MSVKWPNASGALKTALANPSFVEPRIFLGYLTKNEFVWAKLQPYLLSRGYQLRPRYRLEWIPSWKDHSEPIRNLKEFEDAILSSSKKIFDAVRASDGCKVVMKRVRTRDGDLHFTAHLSSPDLARDPRNRSVPLLDFLPFRRFGEFVEAVEQFLQGLDFLHEQKFAHRDACFLNLMMDPSKVIPRGFHFQRKHTHDGVSNHFEWHDRWSVCPVKYYFIDFELSKYYPDESIETFPGLCGQDRTVPELLVDKPYNPFKLDIFQLGNVFMEVIDTYDGLESLLPLARAMTNSNPEDRPSPSRALEMLGSFTTEVLESRVWRKRCSLTDRRAILEHAERGVPYNPWHG
ncbi:hypothetical protein H0H92_005939 [Tricholoma furcatifolium]|nr:hypothetical protein H0H92_005939 [Tricholoma furcatifolium]